MKESEVERMLSNFEENNDAMNKLDDCLLLTIMYIVLRVVVWIILNTILLPLMILLYLDKKKYNWKKSAIDVRIKLDTLDKVTGKLNLPESFHLKRLTVL